MNTHLRKDLDKLKERVLKLAGIVEENVGQSLNALNDLSVKAALEVIEQDKLVNEMEVDIEDECLKILALHQPVASDLRFVVTVLKINAELEHISDIAVNIARRIEFMESRSSEGRPINLEKMCAKIVDMLKQSVDSFVRGDEQLAIKVCQDDEYIDREHKNTYGQVSSAISKNPELSMSYVSYLMASRSLERIGDLCTNIAEDVIYMKRSIIVRHNIQKAVELLKEE